MNELLKQFYETPSTLCVLRALPGYSDDNILLTIVVLEPPEKALEWLKEQHGKTRSLNSSVPNWEMVDSEVYSASEGSMYEAVVVAYYKLIVS
jgi:hypothetical protein